MVHIRNQDFLNGENHPVLVTKVNATKSSGAAFLIWKNSTETWKCEYYCIKISQLPENVFISSSANLHSALEFWRDLLKSVPDQLEIITDVDLEDSTRDVRVTAHEIQVMRNRNGLPILQMRVKNDIPTLRYHVSRYFNEIMDHLLNENDPNQQVFKKHVQETIQTNRVRYEKVVL